MGIASIWFTNKVQDTRKHIFFLVEEANGAHTSAYSNPINDRESVERESVSVAMPNAHCIAYKYRRIALYGSA